MLHGAAGNLPVLVLGDSPQANYAAARRNRAAAVQWQSAWMKLLNRLGP